MAKIYRNELGASVKLRSKLSTLFHRLRYRVRSLSGHIRSETRLTARDIAGPLGNLFSNGWDLLEEGSEVYLKSFGPRVPPSLHIFQVEQSRYGQPIPVSERHIEDWYEE